MRSFSPSGTPGALLPAALCEEFPGIRKEPTSSSSGTESKEDSEDLASGRGPGRCLREDTSGSAEAGHGVVTFGIDTEYPKEELTMTDYTWVIDQVKNANATNDLYEKTLIEFCTEEDSQLGQVASEREDAKNIRITRKDTDLSKKTGLDYALKIAEENPGADL